MVCDSEIIPVLMQGPEPVAVGDARRTVSPKLRAAVIVRDQGCRFPGCGAPVAYTDAHHIIPRSEGGTNALDNLMLLCRRCHRRVHKRGWAIVRRPDGVFEFRLRGRCYLSPPAVRARRE